MGAMATMWNNVCRSGWYVREAFVCLRSGDPATSGLCLVFSAFALFGINPFDK